MNTTENTTEKRKVKHYYQHRAEVEIAELKKVYLPLAIEYAELLRKLNAKSIGEFELKINEKSGFVSARLSAEAYGLNSEYTRLLELEKALQGKLSLEDLTKQYEIRLKKLSEIKQKHTIYFTKEEELAREQLEEAMAKFNAIPQSYRKLIGFNYSQELSYNTFANLHI